jgi:hypothetical protein
MSIVQMVAAGSRHRSPVLVAVALALAIGLPGCSSADDPPGVVVAPTTVAGSAPATPVTGTSAPPGTSTPAATPTAAAQPTPAANPLEGFTGSYAYVETITSSYYSAKEVGKQHKGVWTVTTECSKKCVGQVSQKLKNEDQTFTLRGKASRFSGEAKGSATCIDANGKATGQKVNAAYTWDLKAGKATGGAIKVLNGRKKFEILQNCKGQATKGFTITYRVSLRLAT